MPINKAICLHLVKNRIDDQLDKPYKHKHGKINCKGMLMKKFQ